MKEYLVEPLTTGFFSGTLNKDRLEANLNLKAVEGWRFVRAIHERTRVFGLFSREAHFLVFEREVEDLPDTVLLRQLLRAYGHEPEA
jgi:hypothetical protein